MQLDFYEKKRTTKPRFIYRRLALDLKNAKEERDRADVIAAFKSHVEKNGGRGEFLKFKWCLPDFIVQDLSPDERSDLESWLSARRGKRNSRFIEAFPDCSDEFGVGADFLDSVFSIDGVDAISPGTRVFTMGSCFARNIAVFLRSRAYTAESFVQSEDLNSPLSNAKMLEVATADEGERQRYLRYWLKALYAPKSDADLAKLVDEAVERLDRLKDELRKAAVIVVTIGNALDFFVDGEAGSSIGAVPVAPKFLLLADTEELTKRVGLANRLKTQGARFRMATLAEAKTAIAAFHDAIRALNPTALCIFTLSPVPIESAVGLQAGLNYGSIEIDTVSKSTLRVALHELMTDWATTDTATRYFPSYEIVRWVGPMLPEPTFGAEDASPRHVSSTILNGVYDYFLQKFGAASAGAQNDQARAGE
jgi:hypothetical protein